MTKSIVTNFKKLSFSILPKTKNPKIISFLFLWKAKKKFPSIVLSWSEIPTNNFELVGKKIPTNVFGLAPPLTGKE